MCRHEYHIFQKIQKLEYSFPSGFPEAARDLVSRLLRLDPRERLGAPTAGGYAALKAHSFFAGRTLHASSSFSVLLPRLDEPVLSIFYGTPFSTKYEYSGTSILLVLVVEYSTLYYKFAVLHVCNVGIEWATLDTQTPPTLEPNLPPLSGDASASDPTPAPAAGQAAAAGGTSASASSKPLETGLSDAQFARLLALHLTDELCDGARIRGESNASAASAGGQLAAPAPAPVPDQYAFDSTFATTLTR